MDLKIAQPGRRQRMSPATQRQRLHGMERGGGVPAGKQEGRSRRWLADAVGGGDGVLASKPQASKPASERQDSRWQEAPHPSGM